MKKTVQQIEADAIQQVQQIMAGARAQNSQIVTGARHKSEMIVADIAIGSAYTFKEKRDAFLEQQEQIKVSSMQNLQNQLVQKTKDVVWQALQALDADEYFAVLGNAVLAEITAHTGVKKCTLSFCSKEEKLRPHWFIKELQNHLPAGVLLTLAKADEEVEEGCIIQYKEYQKRINLQYVFLNHQKKIEETIADALFEQEK